MSELSRDFLALCWSSTRHVRGVLRTCLQCMGAGSLGPGWAQAALAPADLFGLSHKVVLDLQQAVRRSKLEASEAVVKLEQAIQASGHTPTLPKHPEAGLAPTSTIAKNCIVIDGEPAAQNGYRQRRRQAVGSSAGQTRGAHDGADRSLAAGQLAAHPMLLDLTGQVPAVRLVTPQDRPRLMSGAGHGQGSGHAAGHATADGNSDIPNAPAGSSAGVVDTGQLAQHTDAGTAGITPSAGPSTAAAQPPEPDTSVQALVDEAYDVKTQLAALLWALDRLQPIVDYGVTASEVTELERTNASLDMIEPTAHFTCPVCFDDEVSVQDAFTVSKCGHRLCRPCALRTVDFNIKQLTPQVCPGCQGEPCPRCPLTLWPRRQQVAEGMQQLAQQRAAPPDSPPRRRRRGGHAPDVEVVVPLQPPVQEPQEQLQQGAQEAVPEPKVKWCCMSQADMLLLLQPEELQKAMIARRQRKRERKRLKAEAAAAAAAGPAAGPSHPGSSVNGSRMRLRRDAQQQHNLGADLAGGAGGGQGSMGLQQPPFKPPVVVLDMSEAEGALLPQKRTRSRMETAAMPHASTRVRQQPAARGFVVSLLDDDDDKEVLQPGRRAAHTQRPGVNEGASTSRGARPASVQLPDSSNDDDDDGEDEEEEAGDPPPTYEAYLKAEALRAAHADQLFKLCPSCGEGVELAEGSTRLNCPSCRADKCVACGVDWHEGSTCEKYQQWQKENAAADEAFQKMQAAGEVRPCPKCGTGISKIDGCHHMVCTKCRTPFCWRCGKEKSGALVQTHGCSCMNGAAWEHDPRARQAPGVAVPAVPQVPRPILAFRVPPLALPVPLPLGIPPLGGRRRNRQRRR